MKDYRKHIGRLQFIAHIGFNKTDFGIGATVTYLDGMHIDDMIIDGFWNFEVEFIFIVLTLNVTDKRK